MQTIQAAIAIVAASGNYGPIFRPLNPKPKREVPGRKRPGLTSQPKLVIGLALALRMAWRRGRPDTRSEKRLAESAGPAYFLGAKPRFRNNGSTAGSLPRNCR